MPGVSAKLRALAVTERGVTALEYALIAAIIGVVTVGAMQGVGTNLMRSFETLVKAVSDDPEPEPVADSPPPLPSPPASGGRARPPLPDTEEEEESPQGPVTASDADDADGLETRVPDAVADARGAQPGNAASGSAGGAQSGNAASGSAGGAQSGNAAAGSKGGTQPGILPSDSALGPGEDGLPVTALRAPPASQGFGANPEASDEIELPTVPPGRESSRDSGTPWNRTASAQEAAPPSGEDPPAETPVSGGDQAATVKSAFILLLWIAVGIMLVNLIWRMATRKAHEREVEDQLEDWRPATFG